MKMSLLLQYSYCSKRTISETICLVTFSLCKLEMVIKFLVLLIMSRNKFAPLCLETVPFVKKKHAEFSGKFYVSSVCSLIYYNLILHLH